MSEEEVDMELLRMIGRYLTSGTDDYEIKTSGTTFFAPDEDRTLEGVPTKWVIDIPLRGGHFYGKVYGDIDGKIVVETRGIRFLSKQISDILWSIYGKEVKKVEKDKDKRKNLIHKIVQKEMDIREELADRKNWDKYASQKPFEELIYKIRCGDEAARKASEEFGVEVIHWMPPPPEEFDFFYSAFDPKGMSREQKFEEVKKRIDAIERAIRLYYSISHEYIPPGGKKRRRDRYMI
ncbi:MAG: hypothetical protein QW385_06310 [Thermoproteota archaeon]